MLASSRCLPTRVQKLFDGVKLRRGCDWSTYLSLVVEAKSIVGCSRNTRIGNFPALQYIGSTLLILLYNQSTRNWTGVNLSAPRDQHCSAPCHN